MARPLVLVRGFLRRDFLVGVAAARGLAAVEGLAVLPGQAVEKSLPFAFQS